MSLSIGDTAPDFLLQSDRGLSYSLQSFSGRKLLLFFYPKNNTYYCTKEVCSFRDAYSDFESLDISIVGISKDSLASHRKFKEKHSLPFPLLSDPKATTCKEYGIINSKSGIFSDTFIAVQRTTFLIDEEQKILNIWRDIDVSNHIQKILSDVRLRDIFRHM